MANTVDSSVDHELEEHNLEVLITEDIFPKILEAPNWLVENLQLYQSSDFEGTCNKPCKYDQIKQENLERENTLDDQVDCNQSDSHNDLADTNISKQKEENYCFENQDLEIVTVAMNTVLLPKRNVSMVQSTVSSKEPLVLVHNVHCGDQLSSIGNDLAISDIGGNTIILENCRSITTSFKASKFSDLMGYDPTIATRYGYPVVDAVAKAITPSGRYILIGTQEGVYNSSISKNYLFCTFKNENSTTLIDSVIKGHRLMHDGLYSTQSMNYNSDDSNNWIEIYLLYGLITCKVFKSISRENFLFPIAILTDNKKLHMIFSKGKNSIISSFSLKNQEFRIDNSTNSNEISDYEKGVYVSLLLRGNHLISLFVIGNISKQTISKFYK